MPTVSAFLPSLPNSITSLFFLKICWRGRGSGTPCCLTWVQAQDCSQQEDKASLHFGIASLVLNTDCFLPRRFIYCGRQQSGMPRRLPCEGTWAMLLTGPMEGLVSGGGICVRCLSYLTATFGATSSSSPPLRPCLSSYPWAKCSHEWKKPKFFRTRLALCVSPEPARLWLHPVNKALHPHCYPEWSYCV